MSLQDLYIRFGNKYFTLDLYLFYWFIGFRTIVRDLGDKDEVEVTFLCFELIFRVLNRRGKDGKRYRKNLKAQRKLEEEMNN